MAGLQGNEKNGMRLGFSGCHVDSMVQMTSYSVVSR